MAEAPQLPVFQAALALYDDTYADRDPDLHAARRAAYAAWWFIENINDDVPDRTDIFFEVRTIVRAANL